MATDDKKCTFMILPNFNLIVEYFRGYVTWEDLIELKKKEITSLDFDKDFNVISDIRNVKFHMSIEQGNEKYIEFLLKDVRARGTRKSAIITINPIQLVNSEMLRMGSENIKINLKTVSTLSAALEWVNIGQNKHDDINEIISNLR